MRSRVAARSDGVKGPGAGRLAADGRYNGRRALVAELVDAQG
jgi:hypothetical protein